MTYNGYSMTLACTVSTVYPKALVVVYVVATHALNDRTQYRVKLFVWNERSPFPFLLLCNVVGGLAPTQLYCVAILCSHKCMIVLLLILIYWNKDFRTVN